MILYSFKKILNILELYGILVLIVGELVREYPVGGNMESRNIKTIDEHGIDRDAHIICGFVADDKKYLLYSIGRDEESDNVFVSGLVDNNDKTSKMVSIDDSMEKIKINEMAKDLITHSLNTQSDKSETEIELPGGNKVKIIDVLFNKEQSIDVSKTYIATVKKSVSKVSEDFYKIDLPAPIVEAPTLPEPPKDLGMEEKVESIDEALKAAMPDLNLNQPIMEKTVAEPEAAPTPALEPAPEVISEEAEVKPEPVSEVVPEIAPTLEPVPEPVPAPEPIPVIVPEVPEIKPELVPEAAAIHVAEPIPESPKEEIKEESVLEPAPLPTVEPTPVAIPEPTVEPTPVQVGPVQTPVQPIPAVESVVSTPIFDGSTESNLNKALGEENTDKVVAAAQDGVESLREFGEDTAVIEAQPMVEEDVKKLTRSKGFANNKFFMAIAIIFFVLSCVFLGYEAFQYFTMK